MFSVHKSLRLALVAAMALIASAAESQAASPYVFGKEPVARHNRAYAARRTQTSSSYRMAARPMTRMYGGTAMVQTYPQPSNASRSYVTPVSGYRTQTASNGGYYVR